MPFTSNHISDADLVALLDGELDDPSSALSHLALCALCGERQGILASSSAALEQICRGALKLAPAEEARLRLEQAVHAAPPPQRRTRWSYAAAAALLLTSGLFLLVHRGGTAVQAAESPDSRLTPGITRPVSLDQVCALPGDADRDPSVTPDVQRAVLRAYGLASANPADYQIDYLINPQLGGSNDLRNLWPEPYHAAPWNAAAKDALEARLHQMVCARQIGLDEAQRAIATDWIAAYKKYFSAARPIS